MLLSRGITLAEEKNSPAYEAYVQQAQLAAEAAAKAAEVQVRRDIIANHLAHFERTGKAEVLVSLAQMNMPSEEAIPVFSRLLGHANPGARGMALYGLSRHGSASVGVLDRILACYSEPHDEVRWRAAEAVAAIGPGAAAAVRPMIECLRAVKTSPRVRLATIIALGRMGPVANEAIPMLETQLNHADSKTAFEAYRAIGLIRDHSPSEVNATDLAGREGFHAFKAMQGTTVHPGDAREMLRTFLGERHPVPQRIMAIKTMGALKPSDPTSVTLLLEAIGSTDAFVADTAAAALDQLDPSDQRVIAVLTQILAERQDRVAMEAAKGLVRFGERAAPALAPVIEALQRSRGETDYQLVGAYLDILRALGSGASSATPLLVSMLPDDAAIYQGRPSIPALSIRRYLLFTLSEIGITADAIPVIVDVLANRDYGTATVAAATRAAGALPSGQELVIPFLLKALHRDYVDVLVNLRPIDSLFFIPEPDRTSVRLETMRALARMGPVAESALPLLRERANEWSSLSSAASYRSEALAAIKAISRQ